MANPETTMGGGAAAFPPTVWSSILAAPDSPERRARLNGLLTLYWRPVYAFIRRARGTPVEESKDLAQEFFCYLLDGEVLAGYQRDRGRFRPFLKGVLRNFLSKQARDRQALKRGGATVVVSMNVEELEAGGGLADPSAPTAEELFDRQWARDVMAQSLEELRGALAADDRQIPLAVYEEYELAEGDRPTYDELARRHGISVSDVKNHLTMVRDRLQRMVLKNVADYVAAPDEIAREVGELFGG